MPYRTTPLVNDHYYHIYNRGVEKRIIFSDEKDYKRFLKTLYYYQFSGRKPPFSERHKHKNLDFTNNSKIVEINCYCLMPNHFHLLIKQLQENGMTQFLGKVLNSYTKYFNKRHKRVGPLFQGVFKTVLVEDNLQFMHLSRYIHLNPYTGKLVDNLQQYLYSSYSHYIGLSSDPLCVDGTLLSCFKSKDDYKEFIEGHADYVREIEDMKHVLLEDE